MLRATPSSAHGCCKSEIPVPWNEFLAVVALGLWSMLSTTAVVNTLLRRVGGHPWPLPLQSKIHFSCKMVAILSKWLSSIFGKHTSMCNCTIRITSSTLITSSIHKKTNYGTYSMTLIVNSGHFEKWRPNLLQGESWMPPYPTLFRMY